MLPIGAYLFAGSGGQLEIEWEKGRDCDVEWTWQLRKD